MSLRLSRAILAIAAVTLAIPHLSVQAAASQHARVRPPARTSVQQSGPAIGQRNATSTQTFPLPRGAGTEVQLSPADGSTYSETWITQDPVSHSRLLAGSNVINSRTMAAFRSGDSGQSWAADTVPQAATGPSDFASDPSIAFDRSGSAYYSYLGLAAGSAFNSQLLVARSPDGGAGWGTPVVVDPSTDLPDKPLLTVDPTGGPHAGRLYLAYSTNDAALTAQGLAVSWSDNGFAWAKTVLKSGGENINAMPVVGPGGEVYVGWDDYGTTAAGQLMVAKSADGGQSFTGLPGGSKAVAPTTIGFGAVPPNYSTNSGGACPRAIGPGPYIDVDRSGTATNGNLYMVWNDQQPLGTTMHIYFARSVDGGNTWSAPSRLDTGNPRDSWEPALAVDQSSGMVTVAWYDRRDDAANKLYRVYYTQSADGGQSFLPSQLGITKQQSDPTLDCNGTGDYMQLVAGDGVAHPVWTDTRNGVNQIFATTVNEWTVAAPVATDGYFNWYDNASAGMSVDNVHILNPGPSLISGAATVLATGAQVRFQVPGNGGETYIGFPVGTLGGPVRVSVTGTLPVISSQRVVYKQSFNEVPARSPAAAAAVSYFNWYDFASPGMSVDNIHILNPGADPASGTVTILSTGQSLPFSVLGNAGEVYVSFPPGTIGGPVRVQVASGPPVLASQRVVYNQSFNEVAARSALDAAAISYFNWYDFASAGMVVDNVHVLNPGGAVATGTVTVAGGAPVGFSLVGNGGETFVAFPPGTAGGPVTVQVTSGPAVIASQRVVYYGSFNEVAARSPGDARMTSYFNWYDHQSAGVSADNLHLLNPGASAASGSVTILSTGANAGFSVAPGSELYLSFPPGSIGGPVRVQVFTGPPILASQRVVYYQSFNEVQASGPGP